jgi:beta-N-acetylhexosaminidase
MIGLERDVAGCLLASFPGPEAPAWLLRRVEAGLGGVCLFAGNVRDRDGLAALTAALRGAREDVIVAVDEEGGDVARLEGVTGVESPGNAALGAVDDPALTEAVAGAIGAALAELGITLDLAPVVDVNANPDNPVIGVRAFGASPDLVARHGAAFVRGLQGAGTAACAKHFPGHGDTAADSHLALPAVDADLATLRARDLAPFAAAVGAGVAAVMTSHVLVPVVDAVPATLSAPALRGLLREELGFAGAVVTDALDMAGIGGPRALGRTAPAALGAGADLLCLGPAVDEAGIEAAARAVAGAVRSGALAEERVAEAAAAAAALGRPRGAGAAPRSPEAGQAGARRAIRVLGPPPPPLRRPLVLELRPTANIAAGEAGYGVGDALAERDPGTTALVLREGDPLPALNGGADRPVVVVVRDAARHAWQRDAVGALVAGRPEAVVVEVGWPAGPEPGGRTLILTHGGSRASCRAVAELLIGGTSDG